MPGDALRRTRRAFGIRLTPLPSAYPPSCKGVGGIAGPRQTASAYEHSAETYRRDTARLPLVLRLDWAELVG